MFLAVREGDLQKADSLNHFDNGGETYTVLFKVVDAYRRRDVAADSHVTGETRNPGVGKLLVPESDQRTHGRWSLAISSRPDRPCAPGSTRRAERTHGKTGLMKAAREELSRLRKENRILREEREISREPPHDVRNERDGEMR